MKTKKIKTPFICVEFEKTIAMFEIKTLEIFKFQSFLQKERLLNLGTKMPYLGVLGKQKFLNLSPKIAYLRVLGSVSEKRLLYLKSAP